MARITDAAARDLDETRRLLYMALLCGRTKKYNLAGTIVNAIKHHQGVDLDPEAGRVASEAMMGRVVDYVEGRSDPGDDEWIIKQIERCIDTLGD